MDPKQDKAMWQQGPCDHKDHLATILKGAIMPLPLVISASPP